MWHFISFHVVISMLLFSFLHAEFLYFPPRQIIFSKWHNKSAEKFILRRMQTETRQKTPLKLFHAKFVSMNV